MPYRWLLLFKATRMKLIFSILGCTILATCSNKFNNSTASEPAPETTAAVSLFEDSNFEKGLYLKGDVSGSPSAGESIYPFGGQGQKPSWELAEWASRHLLHESDMVDKNGTKTYENKGKLISFKREGNTTLVRMDVKASAEYDHPRKSGEAWPHLLIEQQFTQMPFLKDMEKMFLNFEGRLVQCISQMPEGSFDAGLHSAQFQVFVVVQNGNTNSPKYGDYLWFGVPFYDYRYRKQEVYAAQDIGKGDATGKFIYSLGTADYTDGSFHDGNWIKVETDLKPFMIKAINIAKERGYLVGSSLEEFRVVGMNLGWEVPGIFDAGFEFKGFDLNFIPAKK